MAKTKEEHGSNGNGANGAQVSNDSVYVGSDGVVVAREELEDPERPGYLRRGGLYRPREWLAACHYGLLTPRGSSLQLVRTSPDPYKPLDAEAPDDVLHPLQEAEQQLKTAERLAEDAASRYDDATEALRDFNTEYGNRLGGLNEKGFAKKVALEFEIRKAENDLRAARGLCDESRSEFMAAQNRMSAWRRVERSRREEQTRVDAEAAKQVEPKKLPLKDRIAALVRP